MTDSRNSNPIAPNKAATYDGSDFDPTLSYVNDPAGGYDPSEIKQAIETLSAQIKRVQEGSGDTHDVLFLTLKLMYLMSGYGGARIGRDATTQSALTGAQQDLSKAWEYIHDASSGSNAHDQDFTNVLKGARQAVEGQRKILGDAQTDAIEASLNKIQGVVNGFKGRFDAWASQQGVPSDVVDQINSMCDNGNILGAIYTVSRANGNIHYGPNNDPYPGNAQWLQDLNSAGASANQQVTGGSQVMATIAKQDTKTQQSEYTSMNSGLKMITNENKYMVQHQRG